MCPCVSVSPFTRVDYYTSGCSLNTAPWHEATAALLGWDHRAVCTSLRKDRRRACLRYYSARIRAFQFPRFEHFNFNLIFSFIVHVPMKEDLFERAGTVHTVPGKATPCTCTPELMQFSHNAPGRTQLVASLAKRVRSDRVQACSDPRECPT